VVVLLHGYAETSDSWGPLAGELAKSYTVVVPDLRGMGASTRNRPISCNFAETRDEPVIVQITGVGPSSTRYVDAASDPPRGAGSR